MSELTGKAVDSGQIDAGAPPAGTAIVRPLGHVKAVRERCLQRFAGPAEVAASRSARAWVWALGATSIAPVTDRRTAIPPSRADVEAEITEAEQRRLGGTREGRADAAATVLRWLIGVDDHVPVRDTNPGELVGGFGDVVRSPEHIAKVAVHAAEARRAVVAASTDAALDASARHSASQRTHYLNGVTATCGWALGDRGEAPITRTENRGATRKALKQERIHAEDVVESGRDGEVRDGEVVDRSYAEGVKSTISWLLGDSTADPV